MQKNTRIINIILCFAVALAVTLVDQVTKLLVVSNMDIGDSIDVIKGVFRITYITNSGSAFGMLSGARWVFMILSTIGILAICVYVAFFSASLNKLTFVSFGMVVGGGVGNMIDRIFNGETLFNGVVVDFIDFCAFPGLWSWIFNAADSFVCIGVALLAISIIKDEIKNIRQKNSNKEESKE